MPPPSAPLAGTSFSGRLISASFVADDLGPVGQEPALGQAALLERGAGHAGHARGHGAQAKAAPRGHVRGLGRGLGALVARHGDLLDAGSGTEGRPC